MYGVNFRVEIFLLEFHFIYTYRAENPMFGKTDKRVYDYPVFTPEKYDDQSVTSNDKSAGNVAPLNSTDSAARSVIDSKSTAMSMKNPLYVPMLKTQTVNEGTLNSD